MHAAEMQTTMPIPGGLGSTAEPPSFGGLKLTLDEPRDLYSLMADYERRLILLALQAAGGHQRRAAASLGVLPSTLSEKLRRLGLRVKVRRARANPPLVASRAAGPIDVGSAIT